MCFFKKKKKDEKVDKKEEKQEQKPAKKEQEMKETKKTVKETKKAEPAEEKQEKKAVYRVVYDKEDGLWKIKKDGAKRVIDSRKTKEEALARVQELSASQDTKFIVHKKDGKFQKKSNLNLK